VVAVWALEGRAAPTLARAPPVPALQRRLVVGPAAPTQVRAEPVAALKRGALAIRGPSGLVRVR